LCYAFFIHSLPEWTKIDDSDRPFLSDVTIILAIDAQNTYCVYIHNML